MIQNIFKRHYFIKLLTIILIPTLLNACQLISPLFVEYNGVRMDVAKWINHQQLLSMQQKRSLAQLSRAQQKLVKIDEIPNTKKIDISKENAIAMHCARLYLSDSKITQLQNQVFDIKTKQQILEKFDRDFPKLKIDVSQIQCD